MAKTTSKKRGLGQSRQVDEPTDVPRSYRSSGTENAGCYGRGKEYISN